MPKSLKKVYKLFLISFILLFSYPLKAQTACNIPPFLTTTASPNILFVIDVSGSMNWSAYNPNAQRRGWCDDPTGCGWTPAGNEEGYFIPDKVYTYNNSQNYWEETTATPTSCPARLRDIHNNLNDSNPNNDAFWGWCLNFHLMSRMDLLRWATTGGRPEQCDYSDEFFHTDCDPDIVCTGNTCILEAWGYLGSFDPIWDRSSSNWMVTHILVPKSRVKGILQELAEEVARPRIGAMFYSGSSPRQEKVYVGDYPYPSNEDTTDNNSSLHDVPYTHVKRAINKVSPGGGTPTAIALWEAYDYFAQQDLHNYNNGFVINPGTWRDPQYVCEDPSNPTTCQPVPCAKNFVILASDGQWNIGGPANSISVTCDINTGFEFESADPVVPSYRMHTDTLRTMTVLGNTYNVNISGVYALGLFLGGTGALSLQHVAMYGSFDTAVGTWPGGTSGYPTGSGCWVDDCTIYTDGVANSNDRGSACTPLPPSSSDWDKDGDGIPDTFLNASNAIQIKESLLAFIRDILKKTSSASSVSILSRRGVKGNSVLQAVFYPQKPFADNRKVDWTGYLYNYWFYYSTTEQNIREDTNKDKVLNTEEDFILDFQVDTSGNLIVKADDPTTATSPDITYSSLDEVTPVWEAGEILKNKDPANRKIFAIGQDTAGNDLMLEFTTANKTYFDQYLGNTANFPPCLTSAGDPYENLIQFVRGQHIENCRDRRVDDAGNVWKLGDIVYSTPAIVDYGKFGMVFVGANDGMLHAFRIGALRSDGLSTSDIVKICDEKTGNCTRNSIGDEEWAFIPKNALPYLKYLASPDYNHLYLVDLQPYIVRKDKNGDGIPETAILIGGMRLGGGCGCLGSNCATHPSSSCCVNPPADTCDLTDPANCVGLSSYFALDISDPLNPKFLWEFSDPDLGLSYSGPAHIKVGGKDFIMFLSGPTSPCGDASQPLKIFILEMDTDWNIAKRYVITDSSLNVTLPSRYTILEDSDLSSFNNAFGGRLFTEGIDYNEDGNTDFVFFGVNALTGGTWHGNVLGLKITGADPTNPTWDVIKVFNSSIEPITSKVEYMKCFGMNYLFFGTGRWFYKDDSQGQNVNDTEKLYGVRIDGCLFSGNCNINTVHSSNNACTELSGGNEIFSWYRELLPRDADYYKERLISDPAVTIYDVILFATTQPTGNICGFGGRSRLWGLNCATGQGLQDTSCPNFIAAPPPELTALLQLSRGNIEVITRDDFTEEGGAATNWFEGTTPESPPTVPGGGRVKGKIILWIER